MPSRTSGGQAGAICNREILNPRSIDKPQPSIWNLQSAICNLQSAICNLQSAICNLQSAICNLQSAICNYPSAVKESLTTVPPLILIMRCVFAASSKLCVTSTSVVPASRFNSNSSFTTLSLVSSSRLPVGSSANKMDGLL